MSSATSGGPSNPGARGGPPNRLNNPPVPGEVDEAAVLFKPNEPLQVLECELDPPQGGRGAVKMKASGVCQSDWHIMNGDWPSPLPIVPATRRRARSPNAVLAWRR